MNKTYCPLPFKEIYVSNAGEYKLCCHAWKVAGTHSAPEDIPPFEYFFSKAMEEIRDKLIQGEKLKDCNKCYELEETGKFSYRLRAIEQHGLIDDVRNVSLKLRINGSSRPAACVEPQFPSKSCCPKIRAWHRTRASYRARPSWRHTRPPQPPRRALRTRCC